MRTTLRAVYEEAELDITAFMNLMIVLVPVLLMSMVFSHIAVLELQLPESVEQALAQSTEDDRQLELEIRADGLHLFFPSGHLVRSYPPVFKTASGGSGDAASRGASNPDPADALVADLKAIKQRLLSLNIDKKAIVLMPEKNIDYQTLVAVMDRVRSYRAVVVTDVVNAELFPEIGFADAPEETPHQAGLRVPNTISDVLGVQLTAARAEIAHVEVIQ